MKKFYYQYLTLCYLFLLLFSGTFIGNAQEVPSRTGNTISAARITSKSTALATGSIDVANASYGFNGYNPEQLVRNILTSGCLTISNVRFGYYKKISNRNWSWVDHNWSNTAGNRQLGYYNKATSTFPIDEGILLSTGRIKSAMGPNTYTDKSDELIEEASDPDLTSISGKTMHDAAILEFNFVPDGNLVEFKFVFASEEYLEYVHTDFNDAFGFFLSGFGISGPYTNKAINLAQLPNGDAVTVNNIHSSGINKDKVPFPNHNSAYYVNNPTGSPTMEYDGSTVVLTATYAVTPGKSYKIKMAIADASDQKWDAGVFLKAKSFATNTLVITNPPSVCANGTANITLPAITAGSTAGLTYTYWKDSAATVPFTTPTAAPIGTYYIKGTNAESGCSDIKPIEVSLTNIIITETTGSHIDAKCKGTATGSATVSASGGIAAYTYSWNTNPVQTGATASNLAAGTYTVTVTDSKGCSNTKQITITEPSLVLGATTTQINTACNGGTNGSATVTATGGTGSYTYSWNTNPIQTGATAENLAAGTYTVTVKDANLCEVTKTVTISQPNTTLALTASSKTDALCFGSSTGSVTAGAVTNAVGTVTYSWKNSANVEVGTTASVSNLPKGIYTLTVTDSCSSQSNSVTIEEPTARLHLGDSSKIDVLCYGKSTGSIIAGEVTNAVGPVTYSWINMYNVEVGTTPTVSNLPAGHYILTVTDSCSSKSNFATIEQPSARLHLGDSSKIDVLCYGASTGSIIAGEVTNAVGPVTYSWINMYNVQVGTTPTVSNLPAGHYILTVTDSCFSKSNFATIVEPAAGLTLSDSSKTDVSCFGASTGSVTAGIVTNAVGTVTYSWKNSANIEVGTTASVSNLPAGTYTLTVSDSCSSKSNSVIIVQPTTALSCSIIQNKAVSSNGLSNGEATVTPIGGNGDYTYLWDNNETTPKAVALSAGSHSVTVTDAKGCSTTCTVTITEPNVLSCSISQDSPVKCFGESTGKATVNAIGGNADYTYLWDNGETSSQAVALNAGLHTVTVTDKLGYITTCTVTISQPQNALSTVKTQIDVTCGGGNNGSATVTVSGGTAAYTYLWNTIPVQTTATASNLTAGNYTVTITDANGCSLSESFTILDGDSIKPVIDPLPATTTINCPAEPVFAQATATDNNGTISLTYTDTIVPGNCAGSYTKTRTWIAKDNCDNTSLPVSQTIIVQDTTAPTWITLAGSLDRTVECSDQTALADAQTFFPTAADSCDTDVTNIVKVSGQFTASAGCANAGTYTNTWTVKDDCGNISETYTQIITIQDTTAPTWTTLAGSLDRTVECSDQTALADAQTLFPTAADSCDTDVTNIVKVSGQFTASVGCANAGTYTNTWTVKDDCGNTSQTFTQIITIQDTIAPMFTGNLPFDLEVSCDAVPEPAELLASDNCNGDLPIVFSETKSNIQNGCSTNYTLTRTWKTSDCSGNTASYTQIITVKDTTPPTGTVPANVNNLASIDLIPAGNPSDINDAADNCSPVVNITVTDNNNGGSGCDGSAYILTRTYTLTDCAGNKTELVQTFTIENKVSVSGIATNVSCLGGNDGKIIVTNSPGSTVVITNERNEIVGNSNLPAGTYTLTATAAVNGANQTCSATATVVIAQPSYTVKISGQVINVDNNTPLANVPVTLVPQGTTSGPILMHITGTDGMYNFSGIPAGNYLVQVQDANLNSAYQLYPVDSSLFFTILENCVIQTHNFEYGASTLPVLGDYVWYDTNNNGIQDEWYDANNDNIVTKNIPDQNGAIDYSQWEWIDLNGDGSYTGPQNVGELNAGGFGNALSSNVIIDGPNGYHEEIIVGIEGFWRDRPNTANPYGDYTIKLVRDANFDTVAAALGAIGLVKVIPSLADKKTTAKNSKAQLHTVCATTTNSSYIVTVSPQDLVHLDADFGVSCKVYKDIIANDDSAGPIAGVNTTTPNVLNVLLNDTLEGIVTTPSDVIITTITPNDYLHLNADGSVDVLPNAPVGTLTLVYQICEADQTDNCDTATVTITIEAPKMTVTATPICVDDVPYIDYVVTPTNFTPTTGVTIAWADNNNNIIKTTADLPLSGRVLWPGAVVDGNGKGIDWPGWIFENNKWIEGVDGFEKLRPTANLIISLNPSETITVNYPPADPYCTARPTFAIVANDDSPAPIIAPEPKVNIVNVFTNDTLNGTAVNSNDVTLTIVTPDPKGALTLNPNGSVDVAANTPAGTYTLIYQICEKADAGNCDTATVTVIVLDAPAPPTPVVANDDNYNNIGCDTFGVVGNVLSNDLKGIIPATLELVTFTLLSENNAAKTDPNITIDNAGNVTVSSLTPAGTYTYNYRICDKLSAENCDTATITITVIPNGVTEIRSTSCNDDSTMINLTDLLPEGSPITGTWVDKNNTNALQGNVLNPFGLPLGNYIFEYLIADEKCPRSITLNMEVNDDCQVLPCGDVLPHNAISPNGDGMNDTFKIDFIDDVTCYPSNTVEIYNRWGILVFETVNYNNTTNAFDGNSRGRTTVKQSDGLPTGTYFYIINYKSLDGNNNIQDNKLDGYLYLSK